MTDHHPIDILLVEDDDGHTLLIQDNLMRHGVINRIHAVSDGREALDYLYHQGRYSDPEAWPTPGLVLLDLNLPRVDGFEVLRQIKADERLKGIPVIVLTSTGDQREINRSYSMGANNYITKPVDYKAFQEKVHNLGLFLEIVSFPAVEP